MNDWSPRTFSATWRSAVDRQPDSPFLIFEGPDGRIDEWTYAAFDEIIDQVAGRLHSLGVTPGDAVHLALTNSPAFVAVWLAAIGMGAWIVPSDPMARTPELRDHIERTAPVVGVCAASRAEAYRAAAGDLIILEVDEADPSPAALLGEPFGGCPTIGHDDRAAVMFTSGTTGRPKGVLISQANYAFAGHVMAQSANLQASDRYLVVLPMFHANAQYYSFASAIEVGASVALMHGFSASGFLGQAARHRATCASLFAAPMRMILARGGPVEDLVLRHCWFAQNLNPSQYETIANWMGCRPRQLYGMTETIPAVLTDREVDPTPDSMGFVTSGCLVDVQDIDGRSVEPGEIGEIVVGGVPGTTLFSGYLDDPATTDASFRNGWFLTGDRATRTTDGRHQFDGRRSDVLKVAGENVSTVEVEAMLTSHPDVFEAAVVGAQDPIRDEVPVAFVVPATGARPDPDELIDWCSQHLAKAKVPKAIGLLDELPRTSVGKIRKFVLAACADDLTRKELS